MTKKSKLFLISSISFLAVSAGILTPTLVACTNKGDGNGKNISVDLSSVDANIYAAITAKINSSWTDINQETTIESELVTAINAITSPLGVTVSNVDITLNNGNTYKEADVTITFNQDVTGTYTNFNASTNTLTTKVSLDTGIYNNMTTNGFDLSSVDANIYAAITAKVNSSWTDITQETTIESELVTAINAITSPLGVTISNVDINLVDGSVYKQANPITITFNQNITGNYTNFNASTNTLTTKVVLDTGISNHWELNIGNNQAILNIDNSLLSNIKNILNKYCMQYATVVDYDSIVDIFSGDNNQVINMTNDINNLLLKYSNSTIKVGLYNIWGSSISWSNGPNGYKTVDLAISFSFNGDILFDNWYIDDNNDLNIGVNKWDSKKWIIFNDISTNVPN